MDILNCQLINVGGRAYRVAGSAVAQHPAGFTKKFSPVSSTAENDEEYDLDESSSFDVQQEDSQYVIRLAYDPEVFPHIIGQKGRTKLKVEQDTGASITIPRKASTAPPGSREADVIVRAQTQAAAVSAATRLELLIENVLNSNKLEYSHFVSLPLNSIATQSAFESFKASILADRQASAAQIEDSMFVSKKQLHFTVMMLKLYSEQKRHLAKQTLHSLLPVLQDIMQHQPIQVRLKGLEYMNDDPSVMHVAYLGVQDPADQAGSVQKLQQLCTAVVDAYADAGLLLSRDEREVKLHATVLNTRHRQRAPAKQSDTQGADTSEAHQRNSQYDRTPFDGRWLLANYADLDLGVQQIPQIHLSQRGRYRDDGYYQAVDMLSL